VLDERLVGAKVEARDEGSGAIPGRQCIGLPAAGREIEGGVLQLRLRRSQLDRELAEDLGVRVERVAGRTPNLV
jgi:hypothetical protein